MAELVDGDANYKSDGECRKCDECGYRVGLKLVKKSEEQLMYRIISDKQPRGGMIASSRRAVCISSSGVILSGRRTRNRRLHRRNLLHRHRHRSRSHLHHRRILRHCRPGNWGC